MMKRVLCATALIPALLLIFGVRAYTQSQNVPPKALTVTAQTGVDYPANPEYPCNLNHCLFYAGDFDPNGPNPNGLWNGVDNFFGLHIDGTVWAEFTVPKKFKGAKGKTDWTVTGLFVNNQGLPAAIYGPPSATTATWSIVQGVAEGGSPSSVTVICSGTSPVTITPTGRTAFGFYEEYTYLVNNISGCPTLEAGEYWMTVVAQAPNPPAGFEYNFLSDVEDSTPANYIGPGTETVDMSFFTSTFFGFPHFANTTDLLPAPCGTVGCDKFSVGVIGTAIH
jgi:hypothetical protein